MKISAAELKGIAKRVGTSGAERVVFDLSHGQVGATDVNVSVVTRSEALKGGSASFGVDAKQLHEITSKLKKGEVELTLEEKTLRLTCERAKFLIPTTVSLPVTIDVPEKRTVFPRAALLAMLDYVAAAAETKQRFNYTGSLHVRTLARATWAVGTDGCRLAVAEAELPVKDDLEIFLPVVALKPLRELAGGDVEIAQTENAIFITTEVTSIKVTKTTKQFPGYEQFLIKEPKFQAVIKAALMREALEKVAPMTATDAKSVLLQFRENKLYLSTGNDLIGQAADEIEFEQIVPDPLVDGDAEFSIKVNHTHLRDYFADAKGTVTLTANEKTQPLWLEYEGRKLLTAATR